MDEVKNINSNDSNKKTMSILITIFKSLGMMFILAIIMNFIDKL